MKKSVLRFDRGNSSRHEMRDASGGRADEKQRGDSADGRILVSRARFESVRTVPRREVRLDGAVRHC